jgi:uncharacterized protein
MDKHTEGYHSITYEEVRNNKEIQTNINVADELLGIVSYTKHDIGHVAKVSETAAYILKELGYIISAQRVLN